MSVTLATLRAHAHAYREKPAERLKIIAHVNATGGKPVLEALAHLVGVNWQVMLTYTERYYTEKRRWRRKYGSRRQFFYWKEPPEPAVVTNYQMGQEGEIVAIAEKAAGEFAEIREGRRNTLSKTTNSRARKSNVVVDLQ